MQRILLAGLLVSAAFSSFVSLPAAAGEEATYQEQSMNKTAGDTHRQQHRQQILNK